MPFMPPRHDDVAEDEIDLIIPLQPIESVTCVFRAQGLIAELLDEGNCYGGNMGVVLDHENRPLPVSPPFR
jgi:hypothetical protein